MKSIERILFLGMCVFIIFGLIFITWKGRKNCNNYQIENRNYCLLTATNQQEWEKGLMFVKKLDNADGMIFIFPDKQSRSFWNKNTLADLDLYWLVDDKVVGKSFLPSIEKSKEVVVVNSPKPVDKVVELVVK